MQHTLWKGEFFLKEKEKLYKQRSPKHDSKTIAAYILSLTSFSNWNEPNEESRKLIAGVSKKTEKDLAQKINDNRSFK